MKRIFVMMFVLMMTTVVFADTPPSDGTNEVAPKDVVVQLPGAGKDVVINVPYIVEHVHEIPPPTKGNLRLRGGLSTGVMLPGRSELSLTGGLIGEIGHADSLWRLQGTFRAGNCNTGEKGLALNSGLAVMNSVTKNFRMGFGADLLYCSNIYDAPKEQASERIVGGSLRLEFVDGSFSAAASMGVGAATTPIPGSRETRAVLFGGLSFSYLWGK